MMHRLLPLLLLVAIPAWAGGSRDFEADNSEYFQGTSSVTAGNDVSMFAWIKPEATDITAFFVFEGDSGQAGAWGGMYVTDAAPDDQLMLHNGSGTTSVTYSGDLSTTAWTSVAAWFDDTGAGMDVVGWQNGSEVLGSEDVAHSDTAGVTTAIGRRGNNSPNFYMDGLIAQVCIWDGFALTQAHVDAIIAGYPCGRIGGNTLVGWYRLTEDSGNAIDSSGRGNDLTDNNTVASSGDSPRLSFPMGGN